LSTSCKKDRTRAREPKNPDVDECVFKQTSDKKKSTEQKSSKKQKLKNLHYNWKNTILRQAVDGSMVSNKKMASVLKP